MIKEFVFTGLIKLHQDMKGIGEKRAVFSLEYNEKKFSCFFLADITPFRLYLTTLGAAPVIFELEIERGYRAKSYMDKDDYKKLIAYLDLKYDPHHTFKPTDFFKALNEKIPPKFTKRPDYKEVLEIVSKKRKIEEVNKKYFCGWYSNPTGKNVTPENLEKTRSAFGDEKANICEKRNISSCWTDIAKDERLEKLDKLI